MSDIYADWEMEVFDKIKKGKEKDVKIAIVDEKSGMPACWQNTYGLSDDN